MTFAWSKNKKGAALVYAIMVLLLLATVIVALTALSNASYTDAVLAVSDDQSYYYAKSIGLAVKEQFKDGYNIARILASLDEQEADNSIKDPKVTGTFSVANETGGLVNGTIQIRYALDSDGNPNKNMIEVRSACVVNNSAAAVTSVFSCEDDSEDEMNHLKNALLDYDVILTDTQNLSFSFAQASEGSSGTSKLSVYVYAGEDDNVINPDFNLYLDMAGKLTTTGKTTIVSQNTSTYHKITGNMTSYGDLTLKNTSVKGDNGVHCDGNVVLNDKSYVKNDIYARGSVTVYDPGVALHSSYVDPAINGAGGVKEVGTSGDHSARNIYAQSNVTLNARAYVTTNIYTHGNVTVTGKGATGSGNYTTGDHAGNTYVGGSIYSEGNVTISKGAVVKGSVYANGNVYVQTGAIVCGNVQSLTGNVEVKGAIVGGQVNCPKGMLTLDNTGRQTECGYISEIDANSYVFGGIGLFQYNTVYKHTCDRLLTGDCEWMSLIKGNIYVENATYSSNNGTPLLSVWTSNVVYLKRSTACFALENGSRVYSGRNIAGNAYTYITELNQTVDLSNEASDNPYVNMHGAHIRNANFGENKESLRDAYMWNAWIFYANGRCLHLADVQVEDYGYLFASQFVEVWGTATDFSAYSSYKTGADGGYAYAKSGSIGYSVIPQTAWIDVACKMPSYTGRFVSETRCGYVQYKYTDVRGTVLVGSEESDPTDSYVILGEPSTSSAQTRFYGTMHAYVGNFKLASGTRLSTSKTSTPSAAASIYAEVTGGGNLNYDNDTVRPAAARNSFYVEKTTSEGEYRWGSTIQVKGNAYVAGVVYSFDHFVRDDGTGSFTNTTDARFKGTFKTTGTTVNLQGTECFPGEVHATNTSSVTTLKGNLTVSALRLNGSLKLENTSYTLRVTGDMYLRNMSSQIISPVYVGGNLTIQTCTPTTLTPQRAFEVGGDFYLGKNSIDLSSASHVVTGTMETLNGDITVRGGAQIGGAKTASSKKLTIDGGTLAGNFNVGTFELLSGTVAKASTNIYGKVAGKYVHTGGTIKVADIVVNYSSSTEAAISISGSAQGNDIFISADNGFASVTGGSAVHYRTGILRTYYSSTIAGGFEMGITVKNGNLQIGSTSSTSDSYKVGTTLQDIDDSTSTSYRGIYAKGTLNWGYGARAPYDDPQRYVWLTRITAGGDITFGRNDYYVPGRFNMIASENGSVNAYVQMVDGVYAKYTSWIHVSKFLGGYADDEDSGIKVVSGDAYIYGKTGAEDTARNCSKGEYIRGQNEVSGYFKIMTRINADGARIKCKDVEGLSNVYSVSGCLPVSLYLLAPTFDSDGFYSLQYSLSGAFSIEGNLKFSSPVQVKGELYVNGLFKYNGSLEDLVCLGGLYCKNEKVNITSNFRGNVHLPNVTTLALNADIGVNAPKVTNFELNIDITHSLNLASCDRLTVASGRTVSGSIIIKNTGKVINNGTIGESVQCGVYEGSGTVGGNLVTLNSGDTSYITGAGKVTGNIWATGSLNINSTGTFGKSGSYIYSTKNIYIEKAKFNSSMNYILATGGDITLKNCAGNVPKVWNMSGGIKFLNDSEANRSTIASVLSYGTYIYFGTSDGTNYQTVTGDVEWHGNHTSGYAMDFWGGASRTLIKGSLKALGTGNVHTSDAKVEGNVFARNTGTFNSSANGTIAALYVNTSSSTPVTTVSCNATVGSALIYGNTGKTTVTLNNVTGGIHTHALKELTVKGTVGAEVFVENNVKTTMKGVVTGYVAVNGGSFTTESGATLKNDIHAYDAELHLNANVNGTVWHTAHAISSSYPCKLVALGNQTTRISVGGAIVVHGKLVDNCKQTTAGSVIYCKGTYYADLMKDFTNLGTLNFTTEANGCCVIVGKKDGNKTIDAYMNIVGRLAVYSVWNEANDAYYKIYFKNVVRAHALIVNSKPAEALGYSDGDLRDVPESKVIRYTSSTNSNKAQGLDKRAWMENLETCPATWCDIYYDALTNVATSKELVVFYQPVYITLNGNYGYKGTVHTCNTKFAAGSTLYSDGQVSMSYCCLYSKGYSSSTYHCQVPASPNGTYVTFLKQGGQVFDFDGSMFVHCYSAGGDNYFGHTTTNSNIGIYNGNNYIKADSEFKGCTVTDTSGYYGHPATVLMYFGASTFFDGGAHVLSAADLNKDIPSARTIIWVNTGTLFVGTNSYIGNNSRKDAAPNYANLDTNRYSFHPGIFVSQQTTSGSISYKAANGTTYNCEYGSIEVVGSVTLDIMAYRAINIWKGGVVVAKEYSSTKDKKYKAGLYCSTGYVWLQKSDGGWQNADDSNPSGGGWFGLFAASSGGRNYHVKNDGSQVTDATAYVPNGEGYAAQIRRRYTSTADANAWCYTPWADVPCAFYGNDGTRYPGPVPADVMVSSDGAVWTDSMPACSETGRKSAPAQPTISASGGLNTNGDASVNPVVVANTSAPMGPYTGAIGSASVSTTKAGSASTAVTFAGGKANNYTVSWSNPNYSTSGISLTHPSTKWTSDVTKHFDKTQTKYWNTRYIPYNWKLPYYDSSGNGTYAKRVLTQSDSVELNGHMMLKQTSSTDYYLNQELYTGSSLANKSGSLFGWRSSGVSNGGALKDFVVLNGYPEWDGPFDKDPDHKRRTKILVFESGELPYSAFFMGAGTGSEDYASWYGSSTNKTICGVKQKAWKLGDPDVSFYDGSLVFYTCADPADPYGSAAKDLHVVLPQGIGFDFVNDAENTFTVVGKGRCFLYLTSGNTLIFRAKATDSVFANPVGGLKYNGDGTYSPLLYIIGAGTNIDLYIQRMPLSAFVYMPFGSDSKLYNSSNGVLKNYNKFKSLANNATFSSLYSGTGETTSVGSNTLHLLWDGTSGGARNTCGTIVADRFIYEDTSNHLNFKNYSGSTRIVVPDFSNTRIYSASTKNGSNTKIGSYKEYSLSEFITTAPSYSTSLLNWEYKGIKVE